MKQTFPSVLLACLLVTSGARLLSAQTTPEAYRMLDDVRALSADELGGRLIGTPGADSAARYLAHRFQAAGLQAGPAGWFQEFQVAADAPAAVHARLGAATGRNVIGVLPGSDPNLRNEVVILGAHYDHLGPGGFGSLDPDSTGVVHNGADDNASGAAALIHIAGRLSAAPPRRTVVFIAFGGEELGLLGSQYYVEHPPYPLDHTVAMVNMDMIGRLRNRRLIVYGTGTAREFPAMLDSLNWYAGFELHQLPDGYGPSDHSAFYARSRPVLHVFTDLHEDYHRTTDDWNLINADGLVRVADFTASVVRALGDRTAPLTFVNLPAPRPVASDSASSSGYGAYLGSIPDMTGNPGGVRITGVRAESPADRAGLTGGDVITRIGDMDIPDLQAMANALRKHQSGDVVAIVFTRDGREHSVDVTLGSR
ncbi:MAG: M20/M25/M40 family metallo-hydrolase [Gemmatimonadales bacterium]